ncbi:MAG: 50S ribosomal protein L21 [Chloroflexota bacterium]|nr:50S ribosomal protein L21 [Chloroflexota bacterium]
MYAVVRTGGKQYRVEAGSMLVVEKLGGEPGSQVTFDRVLLVGDGDSVTVGTPTVAGASVSGTVLGESLGAKIVVFKFKQKVKYRRRTGHRQQLTRVRIDAITAAGKTVRVEALPKPKAEKPQPKRATAEAKAEPLKPAAKPKARSRTAAAAKAPAADTSTAAETPVAAETAEEPAAAKAPRRSRSRTAPSGTAKADAADAEAGEDKPKPRTRRAAKPRTKPAKEE